MRFRNLCAVGLMTAAASAFPMWAMFERDTPVDTLLLNVTEQVRRNPKSADAHYILGRVYSLAFSTGKDKVRVGASGDGKLPAFGGYSTVRVPIENDVPMTKARLRYLKRSLEEYRIATSLRPTEALYFLGYGWMLEMAIPFQAKTFPNRDLSTESLIAYRSAVRLRAKSERAGGSYGPATDAPVGRESASGILRILMRLGHTSSPEYRRMTQLVAELNKLPSAITPMVVPLGGERRLSELTGGAPVRFDLAGDHLGKAWPWVKPTTGILVWDPRRTGDIRSGRQLFGSATWWMFFRDGYAALASLDKDANGWLTDRELSGIRIWTDANGNGRSDLGEVKDLSEWKITGLRTRSSSRDSNGPMAEDGVRFESGAIAPSFDWTPTSLPTR